MGRQVDGQGVDAGQVREELPERDGDSEPRFEGAACLRQEERIEAQLEETRRRVAGVHLLAGEFGEQVTELRNQG